MLFRPPQKLLLHQLARETPKGRVTDLESLEIALAVGVGHAWANTVAFFLSYVHLALGELISSSCASIWPWVGLVKTS